MTSPQRSSPSDILAAAQSALEAAQAVAGSAFDTAIRLPPASAQLAATLPGLIENLAVSIERLNRTLDRTERMLSLADPMLNTLDRLIPRLEQLMSVGDDIVRQVTKLPGMGTIGRVTGLTSDQPASPPSDPKDKDTKRRR
ncbi:hypothetical protein [Antrihabitans cavernicola]|uniref:Uncharacterized protein n=1 Tax=Antrihabitans cavernicola TaxID=2495913 RepID=A0A5A7SCW8_9NOCA|nr:hypothetical protein [Spelaeibacter cavernicola]KAA0023022.1 hypothetical protein FOY51_11045 [Spelaeibacter cavernicola]